MIHGKYQMSDMIDRKEKIKNYHKKHSDSHRQEIKRYNAKYYKEHKEEILNRKQEYYKIHQEELRKYSIKYQIENTDYQKNYQRIHQEQIKVVKKKYYKSHKSKILKQNKNYSKTSKGKTAIGKIQAKRRQLDFIELNEHFEGSEAHHIDKEFVLYIPKEIHRSVGHNVWTGHGMEEINDLAIEWAYGI